MNSCIYIDGFALYVFCALILLIAICLVGVGCSYIKELKEHEDTKRELDAVNEDNNYLRCQLSKANKKIRSFTYKMPEVE